MRPASPRAIEVYCHKVTGSKTDISHFQKTLIEDRRWYKQDGRELVRPIVSARIIDGGRTLIFYVERHSREAEEFDRFLVVASAKHDLKHSCNEETFTPTG